ncbi:DUF5009 domain-containing protein [Siphonobacter aquaeclarae]|uniref:Predicted acyltransferase n=1 Tax=Siphonobacter aquaeclarae TaxID=563176 RepID=A0A1G9IBX2_9BACT|nr:DUF5009 domain-containing protein [Siphonobacter aquaeclarae]SDL22709.1 Predicted acyltransferase [Siphonobacter aquaeclarae]
MIPQRVASIDVFRAVTMFLMVFVNDLWSLQDIPLWLEHSKADVDFLGFSDVIFPCFLVIVGLSIPFALESRLQKSDPPLSIAWHILVRSVALIVMGVFTVNLPDLSEERTGLSRPWYQILMVIGFFLVWNAWPKQLSRKLTRSLEIGGIVLLLVLLFLFRAGTDNEPVPFRAQWWGILGLIGWSYGTVALLYLLFRGNVWLLALAWLLFCLFPVAGHAGWLTALRPGGPKDWILGNGAFHAFVMTGVMTTLVWRRQPRSFVWLTIAAGVAFLAAGIFCRQYFIISKIWATPTWVFLCCGIALLVYALLYVLVEERGKEQWFNLIRPAGTYSLTCYLIPYVLYAGAELSGLSLPEVLVTGFAGLLKSLLFSLLVVWMTSVLVRRGIRLKL